MNMYAFVLVAVLSSAHGYGLITSTTSATFSAKGSMYTPGHICIEMDVNAFICTKSWKAAAQPLLTQGATSFASWQGRDFVRVAVANLQGGGSTSYHSIIYNLDASGDTLQPGSAIPSEGAAGWKTVEIDGVTFVMLANSGNSSTLQVPSMIYTVNATTQTLDVLQTVQTTGAITWEDCRIGNETFLALTVVRNISNVPSSNASSLILRWDRSTRMFVEHQRIETFYGTHMACFHAAGRSFLAVANRQTDANTFSRPSFIYEWDALLRLFTPFQTLDTHGAHCWHSFTSNGTVYVGVANYRSDAAEDPYHTPSVLYRWDNTSGLVEHQRIPTFGAVWWGSFQIGDDRFHLIANRMGSSGIATRSTLYRWHTSQQRLLPHQDVPTNAGRHVHAFATQEGYTYVAVANQQNATTSSFETHSYIFRTSTVFPFEVNDTHIVAYIVLANASLPCLVDNTTATGPTVDGKVLFERAVNVGYSFGYTIQIPTAAAGTATTQWVDCQPASSELMQHNTDTTCGYSGVLTCGWQPMNNVSYTFPTWRVGVKFNNDSNNSANSNSSWTLMAPAPTAWMFTQTSFVSGSFVHLLEDVYAGVISARVDGQGWKHNNISLDVVITLASKPCNVSWDMTTEFLLAFACPTTPNAVNRQLVFRVGNYQTSERTMPLAPTISTTRSASVTASVTVSATVSSSYTATQSEIMTSTRSESCSNSASATPQSVTVTPSSTPTISASMENSVFATASVSVTIESPSTSVSPTMSASESISASMDNSVSVTASVLVTIEDPSISISAASPTATFTTIPTAILTATTTTTTTPSWTSAAMVSSTRELVPASDSTTASVSPLPQTSRLPNDNNAIMAETLFVGGQHTCVVSHNRTQLRCFGSNVWQQCGVLDPTITYIPRQDAFLSRPLVDVSSSSSGGGMSRGDASNQHQQHYIVRVITGYSFTCVEVTTHAKLQCFGILSAGVLLDGGASVYDTPFVGLLAADDELIADDLLHADWKP